MQGPRQFGGCGGLGCTPGENRRLQRISRRSSASTNNSMVFQAGASNPYWRGLTNPLERFLGWCLFPVRRKHRDQNNERFGRPTAVLGDSIRMWPRRVLR